MIKAPRRSCGAGPCCVKLVRGGIECPAAIWTQGRGRMRRCDCRAGGPRRRGPPCGRMPARISGRAAGSVGVQPVLRRLGRDGRHRHHCAHLRCGVFGHLLSGGGRCPQEPRDPAESRALRFRALAPRPSASSACSPCSPTARCCAPPRFLPPRIRRRHGGSVPRLRLRLHRLPHREPLRAAGKL